MPLPDFKDEAEFRKNWISPFLAKLGYILVNHNHGSGEQGKDFFFADFDRFEHRRFFAVQAKRGDIGAGQTELDKLLNQVKRSFLVKLRFHKEAHEQHVSAVYIMASGSISREAREYISDWCKTEHFGENVYYLDGDTLDRLETSTSQQVDRQLQKQLRGVINECNYNAEIIHGVQIAFQKNMVIHNRCRLSGVDQLLVSPPPADLMSWDLLQLAWRHLSVINNLCDFERLPMKTTTHEQQQKAAWAEEAREANLRLRDAAFDAVKRIDELYSLTIEVVDEQSLE